MCHTHAKHHRSVHHCHHVITKYFTGVISFSSKIPWDSTALLLSGPVYRYLTYFCADRIPIYSGHPSLTSDSGMNSSWEGDHKNPFLPVMG